MGLLPVTGWEGYLDVASSLMTPMHNAVQEEAVGPLSHLHASSSDSVHYKISTAFNQLHLDLCILFEY